MKLGILISDDGHIYAIVFDIPERTVEILDTSCDYHCRNNTFIKSLIHAVFGDGIIIMKDLLSLKERLLQHFTNPIKVIPLFNDKNFSLQCYEKLQEKRDKEIVSKKDRKRMSIGSQYRFLKKISY